MQLPEEDHWLVSATDLADLVRELRKAEALVEKLHTNELRQAELDVKRQRAIIARWLRKRGCLKIPWS
jgi:hypothetical protein